MRTHTYGISRLIHENCSLILTFAHSRASLMALRGRFEGEWDYLDKVFFELPELRADRALLETGTLLRTLDDAEGLRALLTEAYGVVHKDGGEPEALYFRDMTNKIVHAERYEWQVADPANLHVVCVGRDPARWISATIDLDRLASLSGKLAS